MSVRDKHRADIEELVVPEQIDPPEDPGAAAKRAAVLEGIASADAGRIVPYADVRRWLLSWGTKDELSQRECR
jgi:hypothetical protein